jgi:hypothetical protein
VPLDGRHGPGFPDKHVTPGIGGPGVSFHDEA